jgi:type IV pilus assembly protein PilO
MASGFDKYVRWSASRKALVWLVVTALVGSAYFFLGFKPKQEEIARLDRTSTSLADQIQQKQAIAANLSEVKLALAQMRDLLKQALKKLPSDQEIPQLLKTISDLARDTEMESKLFKPGPPKPIEFYAEIPISMIEHGSFYDLARFFDKVSRLPRIVTVEQVNIDSGDYDKNNNPVLKASFTATTFQFLPPDKRPKKDTGKNKKKRRK